MIVTIDNKMLDAALDLIEQGFHIIPILPGEKRPAWGKWTEKATTDPEFATQWWTAQPTHGVGIATGHDGVFVIDEDIANGKTGDDTMRRLEQEHGELPATLTTRTGSGGRHRFLRAPDGIEIRNDAGKRLGPGVDIRGVGGQVVAPPTPHPNGNAYTWVDYSEIAEAPDWLLELLADPPAHVGPEPARVDTDLDDDRPGTRFAAATTWDQLLTADGWTPHHQDANGEQHWTRPGKERREGTSATVGYQGLDILHVFTSSVAGLDPDTSYNRFGYYTATQHGGDHTAAARALRDTQDRDEIAAWLRTATRPLAELPALDGPKVTELDDWLVRWPEFWENVDTDADWLVEPLIAKGRQHAIHAGAKTGKSLVLLELCAALATGKAIFDRPAGGPVHVLYVDYEMSQADLYDRLQTFGYGPGDDLSHLHYCLLPSIAPLDSHEGGMVVLQAAVTFAVELVVIDTTARAVSGPENEADTFRAFYRHTGLALKSARIALVRADHSGKDKSKGQRGSSAKNDDVDVVWEMTRGEGRTYKMRATHRRMSWVPEVVNLELVAGDCEQFTLTDQVVEPEGTDEIVLSLELLDIPRNVSMRAAGDRLREAGYKVTNAPLRAAVKRRKSDAYVLAHGWSANRDENLTSGHGQETDKSLSKSRKSAEWISADPRKDLE